MKTYKIIRFYAPGIDKDNETVKTGLTLEEAQDHCRDPDTREDGRWFDGYNEEDSPENVRVEDLLRLGKYAEAIGTIR